MTRMSGSQDEMSPFMKISQALKQVTLQDVERVLSERTEDAGDICTAKELFAKFLKMHFKTASYQLSAAIESYKTDARFLQQQLDFMREDTHRIAKEKARLKAERHQQRKARKKIRERITVCEEEMAALYAQHGLSSDKLKNYAGAQAREQEETSPLERMSPRGRNGSHYVQACAVSTKYTGDVSLEKVMGKKYGVSVKDEDGYLCPSSSFSFSSLSSSSLSNTSATPVASQKVAGRRHVKRGRKNRKSKNDG